MDALACAGLSVTRRACSIGTLLLTSFHFIALLSFDFIFWSKTSGTKHSMHCTLEKTTVNSSDVMLASAPPITRTGTWGNTLGIANAGFIRHAILFGLNTDLRRAFHVIVVFPDMILIPIISTYSIYG
jgi:hypothetical protein